MPLNYNLGEIENWREVCLRPELDGDGNPKIDPEDDKPIMAMRAVTEVIIFGTMAVGISRITEKDWEEFYLRMRMESRLHGMPLIERNEETGEHESVELTAQNIRDHTGLATDASTMTEAKYKRKYADAMRERVRRDIYNENKLAEMKAGEEK